MRRFRKAEVTGSNPVSGSIHVNALRELETLHAEFGPGRAEPKQSCLERLARTELRSSKELARLHELALFLCACPDSAGVLAAARALLERFARRADLRRWRDDLADSGIAGTAIRFQFFHQSPVAYCNLHCI